MTAQLDQEFLLFSKIKLPGINVKSIEAVLELHSQGATVPFIARYRKEKTGNLDETQIRSVIDESESWQEITKRREFVITEIAKQGSLTDDLKNQISKSIDLAEIEELYRPFKKKKKTKARIAIDAGLGGLADWIWGLGQGDVKDDTSLEVKAKNFIKPDAGFATYEECLRGAQHIIVEKLSNMPSLRAQVKNDYFSNGRVISAKTKEFKPNSKFTMYAEFDEPVKSLENKKATHRYLALRRGWQEGELKVSVESNDQELLKSFELEAIKNDSQGTEFLKECAKIALNIHVIPSVTNELHTYLKEKADLDAITVFADNVRKVLMASPFGAKVVLGLDPGLRTGCKIALVDKNGKFITDTVLHIQGDNAKEKAKKLLGESLSQIKIDAIAVGNGTAGRETEKFIRDVLAELGKEVPVIMISEAGASVYSASDVARGEFPDLDVTVRGAISIARRLQDPLAELVKIEPKSIGVGQYQHDVNQNKLKKSLHEVVESCVNNVGVDINTASESLLQYVAGIGPGIAKNIVNYRAEKGLFQDRSDFEKIPHMSAKVFEQSAGFLRIRNGKTALDATGIHPERYRAVREMLQEAGVNLTQAMGGQIDSVKKLREKWSQLIGEFTFDDILTELAKPGRDPRDPFKVFKFREDAHEIKDLKIGEIYPGLVTNVTNFGAFVDIGVHQDGLVHISQLTHDFVEDPKQVVSPGDSVTVRVLAVDIEKSQISLTMKLDERPVEMHAQKREARGSKPQQRQDGSRGRGDQPHRGNSFEKGGQSKFSTHGKSQNGDFKKGGPNKRGPEHRNQHQQTARPKPAFNNPFAALAGINNKK